MALVIREKLDNGLPGIICGKACHPSALWCANSVWSVEICYDLQASSYPTGGFPLGLHETNGLCVQGMDCLGGPSDPYGDALEPLVGFHLMLSIKDGDPSTAKLMVVDHTGTEVPAGWSAPADGPECVWLRLYGLR